MDLKAQAFGQAYDAFRQAVTLNSRNVAALSGLSDAAGGAGTARRRTSVAARNRDTRAGQRRCANRAVARAGGDRRRPGRARDGVGGAASWRRTNRAPPNNWPPCWPTPATANGWRRSPTRWSPGFRTGWRRGTTARPRCIFGENLKMPWPRRARWWRRGRTTPGRRACSARRAPPSASATARSRPSARPFGAIRGMRRAIVNAGSAQPAVGKSVRRRRLSSPARLTIDPSSKPARDGLAQSALSKVLKKNSIRPISEVAASRPSATDTRRRCDERGMRIAEAFERRT